MRVATTTGDGRAGKVMRNDDQRITWAVAFSGLDLGALREGDWTNLRDDIRQFMGILEIGATREMLNAVEETFEGIAADPSPRPRESTDDAIARVQGDTKWLLGRIADGKGYTQDALQASVTWRPQVVSGREGRSVVLVAAGPMRDVFITQLVFLLRRAGVESIKRCPAPECDRIFWKTGRRKYCSQRCTNRAVFEAWKTTPKGKARSKRQVEAARRAREHYRKHPGALKRVQARRKKGER
jgi:hypothetical protein